MDVYAALSRRPADMSLASSRKVKYLLFVLHDSWPENLALSLFPEHVADLDRVLNVLSLWMLDLTVYVTQKSAMKLLVSLQTVMKTSYVLLMSRAYRSALCRRQDHDWGPLRERRSIPSRRRVLASGCWKSRVRIH